MYPLPEFRRCITVVWQTARLSAFRSVGIHPGIVQRCQGSHHFVRQTVRCRVEVPAVDGEVGRARRQLNPMGTLQSMNDTVAEVYVVPRIVLGMEVRYVDMDVQT